MKKHSLIFLFFFLLFSFHSTKAQSFTGFNTNVYAGVQGLDIQPASIVAAPYDFDLSLLGGHAAWQNNYLSINRQSIFNWRFDEAVNYQDYKNRVLEEADPLGVNTSLLVNLNIQPLSFMMRAGKKWAVALKTGLRAGVQLENVGKELSKLGFEEFQYEPYWNNTYTSPDIQLNSMLWFEVGFTVGTTVFENEKHQLNAAATLKYLGGIAALYIHSEDFTYEFTDNNFLNIDASNFSYGHSSNAESFYTGTGKGLEASSVGADIGVVYAFKKTAEAEQPFLKVGLSVMDIGGLKFEKANGSGDFTIDIQNWYLDPWDIENVADFDDTLSIRASFIPDERFFKMNLPTAISFQTDLNFFKNFYFNIATYNALAKKSNLNRIRAIHSLTLAPRWETKWFTFAMPITIGELGKPRFGAVFRAGPLVIGGNNLLKGLLKQDIMGSDLYFALKIPMSRKAKKESETIIIDE